MTLNIRTTHSETSPIDCDVVQVTNAQCQIVPISILWYIENPEIYNRNILLKPDTKEKQYRIIQHTALATLNTGYINGVSTRIDGRLIMIGASA